MFGGNKQNAYLCSVFHHTLQRVQTHSSSLTFHTWEFCGLQGVRFILFPHSAPCGSCSSSCQAESGLSQRHRMELADVASGKSVSLASHLPLLVTTGRSSGHHNLTSAVRFRTEAQAKRKWFYTFLVRYPVVRCSSAIKHRVSESML